MNLNQNVGSFLNHSVRLPIAVVRVVKGESGERVIEGSKPFVDSLPNIPFGRKVNGVFLPYSKEERVTLAAEIVAKEERAAKRAAKGKPVKVKEPKPVPLNFRESMNRIADSQPPRTVKRDGRWVQVGSDALTAHIEKQ